MLTHYSAEPAVLAAWRAREFVEPDLDPIPRHHAA